MKPRTTLGSAAKSFEKSFFDLTKEKPIRSYLKRLNKKQIVVAGCETDPLVEAVGGFSFPSAGEVDGVGTAPACFVDSRHVHRLTDSITAADPVGDAR